jgi:hypothetical protein
MNRKIKAIFLSNTAAVLFLEHVNVLESQHLSQKQRQLDSLFLNPSHLSDSLVLEMQLTRWWVDFAPLFPS